MVGGNEIKLGSANASKYVALAEEVESLTVDGGADIEISGTLRWEPGAADEAVVELGVEAGGDVQTLPAVTVVVLEGSAVV